MNRSIACVVLTAMALSACLIAAGGCAGTRGHGNPIGELERLRQEQERKQAQAEESYRAGAAALGSGDLADARRLLDRATRLNPYHGAAHNDLGVVFYREGKLYEAAIEFDAAARDLPGRPEPHYNLGLVLEKGGQLQQAAEAYRMALDLAPEDIDVIEALIRSNVKLGTDHVATRKLLQKAITEERRPEWRQWLTFQLLRLGGRAEELPE